MILSLAHCFLWTKCVTDNVSSEVKYKRLIIRNLVIGKISEHKMSEIPISIPFYINISLFSMSNHSYL